MKPVFVFLLLALFLSFSSAADLKTEKRPKLNRYSEYSLGALITNSNAETLQKNKIKGGARIVAVIPGSEAQKIGLQEGDIIIRFDGKEIKNAKQLDDLAEDIEQERTVKITIVRNGVTKELTAEFKPSKQTDQAHGGWDEENAEIFNNLNNAHHRPFRFFGNKDFLTDLKGKGGFLGVECQDISDQLKEYFKVKNGVLVEKVLKNSPAGKAGLKAGDVITKINERKINDYADLVRTLNYYNAGEKIHMYFFRKGKAKNLDVELGKKGKADFDFKPFLWPGQRGINKARQNFLLPKLLKEFMKRREMNFFMI